MPNTPSGLNGGNVIDCSPKDPMPKKRGRGRPKGSRNKGLAEIGYKRPNNNRKVPQPAMDVDGAEDNNLAPRPKKISVRRAATPQVPQHENEVQYIAEDDNLVAGTSTCA